MSFVQRFDSSIFGSDSVASNPAPLYSFSRPTLAFGERHKNRVAAPPPLEPVEETQSPVKLPAIDKAEQSLLEETLDEADDESFELIEKLVTPRKQIRPSGLPGLFVGRAGKENLPTGSW